MNIQIADSHCHLNEKGLRDKLDEIIKEAQEAGVHFLQTICTRMTEFSAILEIAESFSNVFCSIGVHPLYVHEEGEATNRESIVKYCSHPKVTGIGETGLDFYRSNDAEQRARQRESFIAHIRAAQETSIPIIIHTRQADEETVEILQDEMKKKPFKGVIHCFTASEWLATECIKMGLYISASGIVTFSKENHIMETFKKIPLEHLLIETDAPYLAPVPYRGKMNQPAYVVEVAKFLATLRGISYEEIARATMSNFMSLFSKVGAYVQAEGKLNSSA